MEEQLNPITELLPKNNSRCLIFSNMQIKTHSAISDQEIWNQESIKIVDELILMINKQLNTNAFDLLEICKFLGSERKKLARGLNHYTEERKHLAGALRGNTFESVIDKKSYFKHEHKI